MTVNNLYYPDIFNFKSTLKDDVMDFRVSQDGTKEITPENVKGNLLQSILLYDSIFVQAFDLPVLIHFFNGRENAEYITERGLLKVINGDNKALACKIAKGSNTLVGVEFERGGFSNAEEIDFMLQSFRGNNTDYKIISNSLYTNSVKINNRDILKSLESEIRLDIDNADFVNKHRLSTSDLSNISNQDISFINNRLETYRRIYVAQAANVGDIFAEGVLIDVIKEKLMNSADKKTAIDINREFDKLTKVLRVPNVVDAVMEGIITPSDILKIREHKHCIEFRNWLHSNAYFDLSEKENLNVIAAYQEALGKKGILEKWPAKVMRFAATSALGAIPGVNEAVDFGVSAVDTFLFDKFRIGEWRPQLFIKEYTKLLKK